MFVPKASIAWGAQFAIKYEDGKYYIQDLSSAYATNQTLIRLESAKKKAVEPYPIKTGDVLYLAGAVVLGVNEIKQKEVVLTLLDETALAKKETFTTGPLAAKDGVVTIGKSKKLIINDAISAKHALINIADGSITDHSTHGTSLFLRNITQYTTA